MKFTYYLEKISGVSIYPIFSLVTFVVFFVLVTLWVMGKDKKSIEHLENLPFEEK